MADDIPPDAENPPRSDPASRHAPHDRATHDQVSDRQASGGQAKDDALPVPPVSPESLGTDIASLRRQRYATDADDLLKSLQDLIGKAQKRGAVSETIDAEALRAEILLAERKPTAAMEALKRALSAATKEPPRRRAELHLMRGHIAAAEGRTAEAGKALAESLELAEQAGDNTVIGLAALELAQLDLQAGDMTRAGARARRALEACRAADPSDRIITALRACARLFDLLGADPERDSALEGAVHAATQTSDSIALADSAAALGRHRLNTGDPGQAKKAIELALTALPETVSGPWRAELLSDLARCQAVSAPENARALYSEALSLLKGTGANKLAMMIEADRSRHAGGPRLSETTVAPPSSGSRLSDPQTDPPVPRDPAQG